MLITCFAFMAREVQADCTLTSTGKTALTDMVLGTSYKDPALIGGLYPNFSNQPPAAHLAAAMNAAAYVRPLNTSGQDDAVNGRIVLVSIGVSNTSQEFALPPSPTAPAPEPKLPLIDKAHTFLERANADASKNPKLAIVNGALGGTDIVDWSHDLSDPSDPNPDPYGAWATLDSRLVAAGLAPAQVQVVWIKHAHSNPENFPLFPTTNGSDHIAYFQHRMEQLVRNVKYRYPNAKLVFISSRMRAYKDLSTAGHGSREPFTYENAFAIRQLIQQQVSYGSRPGSSLYYGNPATNDGLAPVVLWGPYLWIDGLVARSDGAQWLCSSVNPFQDTTYPFASAFQSDVRAWDGVGSNTGDYDYKHPGGGGVRKVASQLLAFFKTQPFTAPWFLDTTKTLASSSVAVSSGGVTSGTAPFTVQFSATNVDPTNQSPRIVQYAWDFSDGTSRLSDLYSWNVAADGSFTPVVQPHDSAAQNPSKTFKIPGTYNVRMIATDIAGNTLTKVITIQVASPSPASPTVSLITPEPGAAVAGDVAMRATATDPDGTVAGVSFYVDGALVGAGVSDGTGGYDRVWTSPTPGAHDILAIATDNAGLTKSSWRSTITVNVPPPNQPPVVALTSPFNGGGFLASSDIAIDAAASDADGNIASVTFYVDGALLGSGTLTGGSMYRITWTSPTVGAHSLTATATDDDGAQTTSAPIAITVYPPDVNAPPAVTLTSPVASASFTTPAAVMMAATTSDADGYVTGIAFYSDGVFVGTGVSSTSSSYTFAWLGATAGAHSVVAVATDNTGFTTTSAPVSITAASPPAAPLQCTTSLETNTIKTSLRQACSCNQNVLTAGPGGVCNPTPPPACAGTIVTDSKALAYGGNNPPTSAVNTTTTGVKKQFDCQTEIAKATYTYVGDKLVYLSQGYTPAQADALLTTTFDPIVTKCTNVAVAQDASGVVLPQVGAQCSSYVGALGHVIDAAGLKTCMRTTLEGWIRKIGNYKLPVVSMTAPANGSSSTQPVNLTLSASASDTDGTVSQVAFYADGALLGLGSAAGGSYSLLWSSVPAGSHALTAIATDSDTLVTTSTPISVVVNRLIVNQPPTVALTSPAAGATFTSPATITIAANATDADGVVGSVVFYADGVSLGAGQHITGSTYQITWSGAPAGAHSLTAIASDNSGSATTSAAVSITVLAPPSVAITSPASGASFETPASVPLVASASDSDGTVSSVQLYADGVLLGNGTTTNGSTFGFTWAGAPVGVHSVVAVVTDSSGLMATSAAVSIVITDPPEPPVATITSPANGATFTGPASITLSALASSAQGSIVALGFYADGVYLGAGSTEDGSTFQLVWSSPPVGAHVLTALAIDDSDLSTTSAPVSITVVAPSPPVVAMTSPAAGATFTSPASIAMAATATDSDGTIASVKFYANGTLLGTGVAGAGSTYTYTWIGAPVGAQSLTAIATDNSGLTKTSAAVSITVRAAPAVAMTSPAAGATFTSPASIAMAATATDSDGTIASVKFYADGTLLGTGASGGGSTYTYTWIGASVGAHSLTAIATDNSGLTKTSAAVSITVRAAPAVTMTSPAAGATFTSPASIALAATATDSDGTIASVKFYANGTLLGTGVAGAGSTYTYTWIGASVGAQSLTAIATDSSALTTTSAAVSITVTAANQAPVASLTSPAAGAAFTTPAAIKIVASASDLEGALASLTLAADGASVSPVVDGGNGTFSAIWLGAAAGSHALTATATDSGGLSTTSASVSITVSNPPAPAVQCTTSTEASTLKTALNDQVTCYGNVLKSIPGACTVTAPPACAGSVVTSATALSYGPNNPPASSVQQTNPTLKKQTACQQAIGAAVANFIGYKVGYLTQGYTTANADSLAASSFNTVATSCNISVKMDASGVILPQVGAACASYVGGTGAGAVGYAVDYNGLTTCLRSAADVWVKQIGYYRAPAVALTSPAANASFNAPASITLSATASDADGTVAGVWFYSDGALLGAGSLSGGSYSFVWSAPPIGAHALTALATDSDGLQTTSAAIAIAVRTAGGGAAPAMAMAGGGGHHAPFVALASPDDGASYDGPVVLQANALDLDGFVVSVDFYSGADYLGSGVDLGDSVFRFTWSDAPAGAADVVAVATDNAGLASDSAAARILIEPHAVATSCSAITDAQAVRESLARALAVRLGAPPGASADPSAPPCAGSLVHDAVALSFGDARMDEAAPARLEAQSACQSAIAGAVAGYVGDKLDRLARGDAPAAAEAFAAAALGDIAPACDGVPVEVGDSGEVLPAVGAQCDAAVGPAGSTVDGAALTACLRSLLDVWVDRVGPRPQPLRPNVVVLVTNEPSLAAGVAFSGVELTNAFATSALSAPRRASLLTGQYAARHGVVANEGAKGALALDDSSTLATWLKTAGYRTGLVGSYTSDYADLWASPNEPYVPPGWDDWHARKTLESGAEYVVAENGAAATCGGDSADFVRDRAVAFIEAAAGAGEPFFLVASFDSPVSAAPRVSGLDFFSGLQIKGSPVFHSWLRGASSPGETDAASVLPGLGAVAAPEPRVTGVLDALRAAGVLDDTMLIVVSGAASAAHEADLQMPLFVSYPRLAPLPRKESRAVLDVDLAATIAELSGATPGITLDGESLVRVLDGTASPRRGSAVAGGR